MKHFLVLMASLTCSQSMAGGADSPTASTPALAVKTGQVWEGMYSCGVGREFGARLWIKSSTAIATAATLEFYPLRTGPSWPYGRVNIDNLWQGDIFTVVNAQWDVQPEGFDIPKLTKVQMKDAGHVLLMSFSRDDAERTGCTSARFNLLGTLK